MTALVVRGDARRLPLPDGCVDLIVTSPPYFGLRSYTDGGAHYAGQIGSEGTPGEWVGALVECTREWVRVLKPSGSMFINLGDKYSGAQGPQTGTMPPSLHDPKIGHKGGVKWPTSPRGERVQGFRDKSLLGLPWRYALACVDDLGLILRRDIVWAKPNGLPESVTDRCRSSHEYLFHLVKQPRYYAAVDEIRESYSPVTLYDKRWKRATEMHNPNRNDGGTAAMGEPNPLGKLPGSVWSIPSQPLQVPAHLGVDHFAAFPLELPRRCILGWSPPGVCVACGEGRRPTVDATAVGHKSWMGSKVGGVVADGLDATVRPLPRARSGVEFRYDRRIIGYACGCAPYTDHPGTGETSNMPHGSRGNVAESGGYVTNTNGQPRQTIHPGHAGLWDRPKTGPWREYHFDRWTPPPTRPAVVLDPFMGTGTTLLAAEALGRVGVGVDLSADYCRLARWRCSDRGEIAKAMQVPKPPPVPAGQDSLW